MKKGQIRTGVVRNVKFPNRAMVVLEPLEGCLLYTSQEKVFRSLRSFLLM